MFDDELEKDILASCLQDRKFLRMAAPLLEEGMFSTESRGWIWRVLQETFTKHRELASPALIMTRLDRDYENEDDQITIEMVLSSLYSRKSHSPRAALDEVRRFVVMAAARRAADDVLGGIDDGDLEAVEEAFDDGALALRKASILSMPESWSKGAKERLSRYESYGKPGGRLCFKTMSETINHRAIPVGGLPVGKLGEVLATTNVGKTTFLVDLGFNALIKSQAVVLHITTEDPQEDIETRYDARISRVPRGKLETGSMTPVERKQFLDAFEEHPHIHDRLFVSYLPKGHKITLVGPLLESIRERHPTAPILLNYDSPYHAQGVRRHSDRRHELREVAEYIDNLTKDAALGLGDVACWFTHHGRRKDAGRVPTAESGAESYDIERIVDFMIGLREGESLDGSTEVIMEAWIAKNRLGPLRRAVIYLKADLGICYFREVSWHEISEDEDDA